MVAGAGELESQVEPALDLLERSVPATRRWDDALTQLGRTATVDLVRSLARSLDPSSARRVLTAHVIAATFRADEATTSVEAFALLGRIDTLLEDVGLDPEATRALARTVISTATSLKRLRGPLDGIRRRVWSACFGSSIYEAPWHWRDLRDQSVMILGETGTGKELIAQTIGHANLWFDRTIEHEPARKPRVDAPCIAFNVAALPPSTAAAELFGWERGAFTGAERERVGLVEAAHGGTLFMDEIGDIPPEVVAMLLRALSAQEVLPLGATKVSKVQARWVTATSKDIDRLVADGRFTEDLRRRLSGIVIHLPPLRTWAVEDVRDLALELLVAEPATATGPARPIVTGLNDERRITRLRARFADELGAWLLATPRQWPGNVRQLAQLVKTWKMQGGAEARADLERIAASPLAPAPADGSIAVNDPALAALQERVLAGTATLREVKAWYVANSRRAYDSIAAHAAGLGVDVKTLKKQREDYEALTDPSPARAR